MPGAHEKIVQYLREAHATEQALARTLQAHIAVTPRGTYRDKLERHLAETQDHAEHVEGRLSELGEGRNLARVGAGAMQSLAGQALAMSKGPIDLLRGASGEEKLLKNAKDECATEALEIATYDALEALARSQGDDQTAALAAEIRSDEERMLGELREEIPALTDDVVRAEVIGDRQYDVTTTGAADALRRVRGLAEETARRATRTATSRGRRAAREARKVPGVARVEGEARGAVAAEEDLPIPNYDSRTAADIVSRLNGLSQVELGQVDAYERKNRGRKTVLNKIRTLRTEEPGDSTAA
ncbi:MAG: ferritin-like domain-containing protein [Actinomycetota bacterium]|nr:ferritin-like domain-containing protein [Actinomycetota bacterium]